MQSLALVLATLLPVQAAAQGPAPSPKPRSRPSARPAARPTPAPLTDELLTLVKTTPQTKPEREVYRKLLLASISAHRGQTTEATAMLDEAENAILDMPRNRPDDPKSINFDRMWLWWDWIAGALTVAPERGLASIAPFAESANPNYSGPLLESMAKRVDCSRPSQKSVLDSTASSFFDSAKTAIGGSYSAWGLNGMHAAVLANLRCGSTANATAAGPFADSLIQQSRKMRIECDMLELRGWSRLPAVERSLASFREDTATDFSNHVVQCEAQRLRFAADLMEWAPPSDAVKPAVVSFVSAAVADYKPVVPDPPAPEDSKERKEKSKKTKGPLPAKGSDLYAVSSGAASLKRLVPFMPETVAPGADRLFEIWVEDWKPGASGGDRLLASIASVGAALAKAGHKPAWLCGVTTATPKAEIKPESQATLARERLLAGAEIFGACPAESEAALKELKPAEDPSLVSSVVVRLSRVDAARAESLARSSWPAIPADKRYDFAYVVVDRLLGVPEH